MTLRALTNYKKLKNRTEKIERNISDFNNKNLLSANKVTGFSVNFPITSTCKPSKVCTKTCYALTGPISWDSSLSKQIKNQFLCKESPRDFAKKLNNEIKIHQKKSKLSFIRWNGVGDLFPEAIIAINELSNLTPTLPIWVVTRIPEYAASLAKFKNSNVYIHFSIDRKSIDRQEKFLNLLDKNQTYNIFFSYQCDKNETYIPNNQFSVVFADQYNNHSIKETDETTCPLNLSNDIEDACNKCRRCFNDKAVKYFYKNYLV